MRAYKSGLMLILAVLFIAGCKQDPPEPAPHAKAPKEKKPEPAPPKKIDGDPPAKKPVSNLARQRDVPEFQGIFRQIGLAYDIGARPPSNREELVKILDNNARILELLKDGTITVIYGARKDRMPEGTSKTVLAYETDRDVNGNRLVLMGDGSVHMMPEGEFNKAPKAMGK